MDHFEPAFIIKNNYFKKNLAYNGGVIIFGN